VVPIMWKQLGRFGVHFGCGQGYVDRVGSYDELLDKSCRGGCDLGIPYERYLWQVHVR
jgi:hypothetical protein